MHYIWEDFSALLLKIWGGCDQRGRSEQREVLWLTLFFFAVVWPIDFCCVLATSQSTCMAIGLMDRK